MGLITILTTDRVFGRMLELELTAAGHSVTFDRGNGDKVAVDKSSGDRNAAPDRGISLDRNVALDRHGMLDESIVLCDIDSSGGLLAACDRERTIALSVSPAALDGVDAAARLLRPFTLPHLLEQVERLCALDGGATDTSTRPSDHLFLETSPQRAYYNDMRLELTRREYELLACLYERRGTPLSRAELIRLVWHYDFEGQTNVVDVYIRYLREKIDLKFGVKLIETVRGRGYRMN